MSSNSESLKNGLRLSIDWIRFTVTAPMSVSQVIEFMGFSDSMFCDLPRGANGYRRQKKYDNIAILYDGAEDMGIHVCISGSSVSLLLDAFKEKFKIDTPFGIGYDLQENILTAFCAEVLEIGHFTRLDIAIDDIGQNYYSPDEVFLLYNENKIATKFRRMRRTDEVCAPGKWSGYTVYFGSRKSLIMLRIYDKQLERNQGLSPDHENYIHEKWIRWEMELTDERAEELAHKLAAGEVLGHIGVAVLAYYFRIIKLDDSNRSRCSNDEKWEAFINGIEKLRLSVPKASKTLEEKKQWVEDQVGPTLSLLLLANGGDPGFLEDIALKSCHRISTRDRELLRTCQPDVYEQFIEDIE